MHQLSGSWQRDEFVSIVNVQNRGFASRLEYRDKAFSVRAECSQAELSIEGEQLLTGGGIPDSHTRRARIGAGDTLAIGTEAAHARCERADRLVAGKVPED